MNKYPLSLVFALLFVLLLLGSSWQTIKLPLPAVMNLVTALISGTNLGRRQTPYLVLQKAALLWFRRSI